MNPLIFVWINFKTSLTSFIFCFFNSFDLKYFRSRCTRAVHPSRIVRIFYSFCLYLLVSCRFRAGLLCAVRQHLLESKFESKATKSLCVSLLTAMHEIGSRQHRKSKTTMFILYVVVFFSFFLHTHHHHLFFSSSFVVFVDGTFVLCQVFLSKRRKKNIIFSLLKCQGLPVHQIEKSHKVNRK